MNGPGEDIRQTAQLPCPGWGGPILHTSGSFGDVVSSHAEEMEGKAQSFSRGAQSSLHTRMMEPPAALWAQSSMCRPVSSAPLVTPSPKTPQPPPATVTATLLSKLSFILTLKNYSAYNIHSIRYINLKHMKPPPKSGA